MPIIIPETTEKLAKEIIKSWQGRQSKYIIMAAPLVPARPLFNLLKDVTFVESIIGKNKFQELSIASLENLHFVDDKRFVSKILKDWGLNNDFPIIDDPVLILEEATKMVIDRGQSPILLVQRFHDALSKLSEDIGVTLRNLNDDFNLKTVVELPIPLEDLRQRWANSKGKAPFLVSDFGQGHLVKLLLGFSLPEIKVMILENKGNENLTECFYSETGGIPDLVIPLLDCVVGGKEEDLINRLRLFSVEYCRRMLGWLDQEDSFIYKKVIRDKFICRDQGDSPFKLDQHPWGPLLLSSEGFLKSNMVGMACFESMKEHGKESDMSFLLDVFQKENYEAASRFCKFSSKPNYEIGGISAEIWRLIAEFEKSSIEENWADVKSIGEKIHIKVASETHIGLVCLREDIEKWIVFSEFLCRYLAAKSKVKDLLRLEEFLQKNNSSSGDGITVYLQLKKLRLKRAGVLSPLPALKSIVETPETIVQVYLFFILKCNFHKFEGFSEIEESEFRQLLKGQPYNIPRIGDMLTFDFMLKLCLFKNSTVDESLRLIKTETDANNLSKIYKDRCYQVHSTGLTNEADWRSYRVMCENMIINLMNIFKITDTVLDLPKVSSNLSDTFLKQ